MSQLIVVLAFFLSPVAHAGDLRIEAWEQDVEDNRVKAVAEVHIDGEATGLMTPAVVRGLSSGTHEVELRSGCALARGSVMVPEQGNAHFEVDLETQPATLTIQVVPATARLQLDGREIEVNADLGTKIECGAHTLSASLPGYSTALTNVDLAPGEIYPVMIELDALGEGQVSIRVDPDSARVFLDGEALGKGDMETSVFQGPHVVEARLKGHVSRKDTFFLVANESYTVDLVLQPEESGSEVRASVSQSSNNPLATRPKALGLGLTAVGSAVLIYGGVQLLQTMNVYGEYKQRVDTVNSGFEDPSHASDFYNAEVATRAPRMRATLGLGAATLAGGLVLSFRF